MQASAQARKAKAPFDDSDADIVLQTSDNVTFRIHSLLLSKVSSVFRDMLTVPHPPATSDTSNPEYVDGMPVVRVTEDSGTMDAFLRCCYPVPNPTLYIWDFAAIYRAADKYDVEAVKQHVARELSRYIPQTDYCLFAYVLACHFGLRDKARRAARQTLEIKREDLLEPYFPELELVPASTLVHLLNYRRLCRSRLADLFTPIWHIDSPENREGRPPLWELCYIESRPHCSCVVYVGAFDDSPPELDEDSNDRYRAIFGEGGGDEDMFDSYWVKAWCMDYMTRTAEALRQDNQHIHDILRDTTTLSLSVARACQCAACGPSGVIELTRLVREIEKQVEDVIAKVPFDVEAVCK
ncbi:hypothetical protein NM688_g5782 [Phlebia brevispora]|uniref:Uncharacterized protein n=1 Tax=Phlebia brevispora TaxID=194682 RepID=A0ACC1SQB7_9APHY|nr:hypothetical protein NM688_g5782 [Phlebia brevispora]